MIKLSDVKVRPQYRTRVRYRLVVLEYAWEHGPAAAGRHYGLSARTIRRWRKRWRRGGVEGLVPSYPRHRARRVSPAAVELIRHARQEFGYGAARTRLWLQRVHGIRLAIGTIQRVFRDMGLPRLRRTRKREPRQMKLFEKAEPGESIQVDVKYVQIAGRWASCGSSAVRRRMSSRCCTSAYSAGWAPASRRARGVPHSRQKGGRGRLRWEGAGCSVLSASRRIPPARSSSVNNRTFSMTPSVTGFQPPGWPK
jgi:transposase